MYSNLCLLFNTFFSVLRKKKKKKQEGSNYFFIEFFALSQYKFVMCVRFFITYNISFLNLKLMKHVERNLYCKG